MFTRSRLLAAITIAIALAISTLAGTPAQAQAEPVKPAPTLTGNTNSIWFDNWRGLSNATLKVAAPDGTITTETADSRSPVFRLSGTRVPDGIYRFEMRAATKERVKINPTDRPRDTDGKEITDIAKQITLTGAFKVTRGVITLPSGEPESR